MIIVTGASSGIGLAICERLLQKGNKVLGLSRNVSNLKFNCQSCDVSSYDQIKAIANKLRKNKTLITGIINAAGIASMNLALTTPPAVTENIIRTNLMGTIFSCQLFSPLMIRNKNGSIINFSTIAVDIALKGESVYVASKSGVEAFSRVFAKELSDFNIRVNCISPGPIDTNLIKGLNANMIESIISQQVLKRQFNTQDICDLIELLLDPKASSLSGQVLNVGGR